MPRATVPYMQLSEKEMELFQKELQALLHIHRVDTHTGTPANLVAEMVVDMINAVERMNRGRDMYLNIQAVRADPASYPS